MLTVFPVMPHTVPQSLCLFVGKVTTLFFAGFSLFLLSASLSHASNIGTFFDKKLAFEYLMDSAELNGPVVPPFLRFEIDIQKVADRQKTILETENVRQFYGYFLNVDTNQSPHFSIKVIISENALQRALRGEIDINDREAISRHDENPLCFFEVKRFFGIEARIVIDDKADVLNCMHQSVFRILGIRQSSYFFLKDKGVEIGSENLSVFRVLDVIAAIIRNYCLYNFPKSEFEVCVKEKLDYE